MDTNFVSRFTEPIIDNLQDLSRGRQILTYLLVFFIPIGIFFWRSYLPKNNQLHQLKIEHNGLEKRLDLLKKKTKDLDKFLADIKKAEKIFITAKKVLPDTSEIPSLLDGISRSGHDAGLEFVLFEPKPNITKDFYAEIPVAIQVRGNYHNVAAFFDRVARLPRIVNINDINMAPQKGSETLLTTCTAVTYKFIEAKPNQKDQKEKKDKKKKG